MNKELAEFAEEVRCAMIEIMGAGVAARFDLVGQYAGAMCTRAAGIKEGELMKAEQSGGEDRYALAALRVNLGVEAPELLED